MSDIIKVIYSPVKAFKGIIQNPQLQGPILIFILYVAATAGATYVLTPKMHYEQVLPTIEQGDRWTENRTGWISNASISEAQDAIGEGYYGNKSIEFAITNSTRLWMKYNKTEQIDCLSANGYKNMSIRIKVASPALATMKNASLYVFSSPSDYFVYNLTRNISPSNNTVWNNLTIPLGPEKGWMGNANADWNNINGLGIELLSTQNTSWIVRLDGLFFRGPFKSLSDTVGSYALGYSLRAIEQFAIRWFVLSIMLYAFARAMDGKTRWKLLLVLAGFALVTMVVQVAIDICVYSLFPPIRYTLEASAGTQTESYAAISRIFDEGGFLLQISVYIGLATLAWGIILSTLIVRLSCELSWFKSGLIAVTAYGTTLIVEQVLAQLLG